MNIGIYGGTFDPPHVGHVTAARAAMEVLGLDKLVLVPDAQPPHKALPEGGAAPRWHRAGERTCGRRRCGAISGGSTCTVPIRT